MTYVNALEALAPSTRRAVFERLRKGPLPASRLAEGLSVSRPAVSQHLQVLKRARLVREEARGRQRIYSIDPAGLEALRAYLDTFWDVALDRFKQTLEEGTPRPRKAKSTPRPRRKRSKP